MIADHQPIGVFDSGIGGLTVLKALTTAFPQEHFLYFADTANLPYGNKSPQQLHHYTSAILQWMVGRVKLVVAACHTTCTTVLDALASSMPFKVIGMLAPTHDIILAHKAKRIGLIATPVSIASKRHEMLLKNAGFQGVIQGIACPRFVPLIEDLSSCPQELAQAATAYLRPFHEEGLDTLVYGCTHYPLLEPVLKAALPPQVICLDPAQAVVQHVQAALTDLTNPTLTPQSISFYCTQGADALAAHIRRWIPWAPSAVTLVSLNA